MPVGLAVEDEFVLGGSPRTGRAYGLTGEDDSSGLFGAVGSPCLSVVDRPKVGEDETDRVEYQMRSLIKQAGKRLVGVSLAAAPVLGG